MALTDLPISSSKPPCHRDDAVAVVRRLRDAGHIAYFAGGCVRDLLLGLSPKDYDVATDAPPEKVRKIFPHTQAVGAIFGVILVHHHASVVEVATFRTDGEYLDGRRPSAVHFTNSQEDAKRRDFTINGLFLDPLTDQVIDYVGGQEDLRRRLIRAIGEPSHRFEEDRLRLLRAVRFAARFGFEIEPQTVHAIRAHAVRLPGISPERIAEELRLMFPPATRSAAYRALWDLGLLAQIFRRLPADGDGPLLEGKSLFLHLPDDRAAPFALALTAAALDYRWHRGGLCKGLVDFFARDEAKKTTHALRHLLKISNDESDDVERILTSLHPLLSEDSPALARERRFLGTDTLGQAMQLLDAMALIDEQRIRVNRLRGELPSLPPPEPPLITGDDLVAAGLKPGPIFKRILDSVYDMQLEGKLTTREDAMARALQMAKE